MSNELQELMKNNPEWYKDLLYRDVKVYIRDNINSASRSFVAIGYYLKYVRDNELFSEDGYNTIWEFAKGEFGISKSQASKFMSINDKFSVHGNSPILIEQYRDFSSSKLSEMLYLTDEQLEQVTVETTVAEIREIRKPEEVVSISKQEPDCFIRDEINASSEKELKCSGGIDEDCQTCDKSEPETVEISEDEFILGFYQNCMNALEKARVSSRNSKLLRPELIENHGKSYHGGSHVTAKGGTFACYPDKIVFRKPMDYEVQLQLKWGSYVSKLFKLLDAETVIDGPDDYCLEPESKPCDTCGYGEDGCDYPNADEDPCLTGEKWIPKDDTLTDLEPAETVEADIIQTEQEECFADQCADRGLKFNNWLKANNFSIAQIVSDILCDIPLANDKDPFLSSKVTNRLISSLIIKTDAYYSYLTKELDIEPEPVKSEQPELPILRNNDQRKEFIEAYTTWPIWIDQELTGERYYRYDFNNGDSMVVKVYYCKVFDYKSTNLTYEERFRDDWGKEEYYLLEPDKYFKDCETNKSALVDYLKEIQKK